MKTIDDYLDQLPEGQKSELQRIRKLVKELVPDAEEAISYNMPTMKYRGKSIIHFAAFKNHMSIFGNVTEFEDKLKDFKTSKKGTLQFTEEKPIPDALLKEIIHNSIQKIVKA